MNISTLSVQPNCYELHKIALLPLVSTEQYQAFATVKEALSGVDEGLFVKFLLDQGLAPLWYEGLKQSEAAVFSPSSVATLKKAAQFAAINYLKQQCSLKKIEDLFRESAISHVVFKGAHIREFIYSNPAVRTACDIDILISKEDQIRAVRVLVAGGFSFHPVAENISHEVSLNDNFASIDLHWDILRPGRTRIDLTEELLASKQNVASQWGLSDEATLFVMLVHPVFTKYCTTPHASLLRIIDLVRWVKLRNLDWDQILDWLKRGGLLTASWITVRWLEMLTGITLPDSFVDSVKPSSAKAFYLQKWLSYNLSTRLLNVPLLIQVGFTLPAHDCLADSCRAVSVWFQTKQSAGTETKELESACRVSPKN